MDTNLKKSKKIRAFCYRMIAIGALFCTVATGIAGRNALQAFSKAGTNLLSGDFYYLPQFQTYMANLYDQAVLGYIGIGDASGYAINNIKACEISNQAKSAFLQTIDREKGDIIYAARPYKHRVVNGESVLTAEESNISYPVFSTHDGHLLLPSGVSLCYYWDGPNNALTTPYTLHGITYEVTMDANAPLFGQYKPNQNNSGMVKLVLAVRTDGNYQGKQIPYFAEMANNYQRILITFFGSLLCTAIFTLLSILSKKAYRVAKIGYAGFSRKIWLEIKLMLIGIMAYAMYFNTDTLLAPLAADTGLLLTGLLFPAGCLLYLLWIDLLQNNIAVFANSSPVKLAHFIKDFLAGCYWYRRLMIICTLTMICSVTSIVTGALLIALYNWKLHWSSNFIQRLPHLHYLSCILLIAGLLLFIFYFKLRRFTKDTRAIIERLAHMELDNLKEPLTLPQNSMLQAVASDINRLENSIENAVEQKNRSNKMRVELITNISHDLKTPLTSIINYADLLCEEDLPAPASEYANALKKKADRLKKMVQDVFDLSKATSGNLPVEKHPLDLAKLVRQTLADMDERISQSNLLFKTVVEEEPLMIVADGDKLYRVFQNLIVNALQYSLNGSRVHIRLFTENNQACATLKNTSKWELDFDTSEIMERFVRADASRTTEGSGLGLSIVQSYTEACGGTFAITTDADMFTACVRFPLMPDAEAESVPAQSEEIQ